MSTARKKEIAPGIIASVDFEQADDGAMPQVLTPFANASAATRPSDEVLEAHGLKFDRIRGTYVNADDGRPANISPELYKKLFGVTHRRSPLIVPAR